MSDCGDYSQVSFLSQPIKGSSRRALTGLHFYGVHLLQWMIEDTGSVNCLEAKVFVVEVSYKE